MRTKTGFAIVIAAAICAIAPLSAMAQDFTVVVTRSAKNPKETYVWTANCAGLNVKSSKQVLSCTLERQECSPGKCPFETNSTDQAPWPVVIGISSYNPTCGWVWDPFAYRYVYRCW